MATLSSYKFDAERKWSICFSPFFLLPGQRVTWPIPCEEREQRFEYPGSVSANGGHSVFRVIPQSPVQFVTDPADGAFDLVVSVEARESSFYEYLCQAQRLSNARMEIWGLWLMSQSRSPEHAVRKEQFASKVWCATHTKPYLLTAQASWERLPPSWRPCFLHAADGISGPGRLVVSTAEPWQTMWTFFHLTPRIGAQN